MQNAGKSNYHTKKCTMGLIIYEIRNIIGNPFIPFFGLLFPILMSFLLTKSVTAQIPESMKQMADTSIVITMSMVSPMSILLIGHAATYSLEIEKGVPLRIQLFGYQEKSIVWAKLIAQLIFMTISLLSFGTASVLFIDLQKPKFSSLLCLIGCLYLLSIIFFILAHAIAGLLKRFGLTFAVIMTIYFLIMILCGMFGISYDQLPKPLQAAADTLPMSYISNDFIEFWQGGSYRFAPLIQSFLFLGALSGILLVLSIHQNKRVIR